MSGLSTQITQLQKEVRESIKILKIEEQLQQLKNLEEDSKQPDFWSNQNVAQETMKSIASLHNKTDSWVKLEASLIELVDIDLLGDDTLTPEIDESFAKLAKKYEKLKKQLAFRDPFDDHDAILSIYAGAGGTDAQDWASMLLRMYTRWAESAGAKVELIDQSSGEEAGIKSATLSIGGLPYTYGKLKGEHGVHRLVRLSPFNSDNLRQTSFAKVDVVPKIDRPDEVEINHDELKIDVYRSGGHGGQSVNTTDSAVRVTHLPTNITVSIQNERSQLQNKETALTILRSKLAKLQLDQHKDKLQDLKGPNQSAEWGNQVRNYVLHPYKQVKDLRTHYESSDPDKVLDGNLDDLIDALVEQNSISQA